MDALPAVVNFSLRVEPLLWNEETAPMRGNNNMENDFKEEVVEGTRLKIYKNYYVAVRIVIGFREKQDSGLMSRI